MPVLIEAHSIVVRCAAIHKRYPGGWDRFAWEVPNRTLCSDEEIARVGFMSPVDAQAYANHLVSRRLRYYENGAVLDLAPVFQLSGLTVPCAWLQSGRIYLDTCGQAASVACCRLSGGSSVQLATPANWKYQGSLSQTYGLLPGDAPGTGMNFLRHHDGMDVYYDTLSEKEVFVGRTGE